MNGREYDSLMFELKQRLRNVCGDQEYKNLLHGHNLIDLTYHSTRIEGNVLDRDQTIALLRDQVQPDVKDKVYAHMSEDHHAALMRIVDDAYNVDHQFSPSYLQLIAGMVLSRTGSIHNTVLRTTDESKGDFRIHHVQADGDYFVSYSKIYSAVVHFTERVKEMMLAIKRSTDRVPLVIRLAIFCHFSIIEIHPFSDGNGRTARLIMNYFLLKYDLPLLVVHSEHRDEYIKALKECRAIGDMGLFLEFCMKEYINSIKNFAG